MNRETATNVLANMRDILADLASPEFASQMAKGPINGFIDSREMCNMFLDFYNIFEDTGAGYLRNSSVNLAESGRRLNEALECAIDVASETGMSDAQLVTSPYWKAVELGAIETLTLMEFVYVEDLST